MEWVADGRTYELKKVAFSIEDLAVVGTLFENGTPRGRAVFHDDFLLVQSELGATVVEVPPTIAEKLDRIFELGIVKEARQAEVTLGTFDFIESFKPASQLKDKKGKRDKKWSGLDNVLKSNSDARNYFCQSKVSKKTSINAKNNFRCSCGAFPIYSFRERKAIFKKAWEIIKYENLFDNAVGVIVLEFFAYMEPLRHVAPTVLFFESAPTKAECDCNSILELSAAELVEGGLLKNFALEVADISQKHLPQINEFLRTNNKGILRVSPTYITDGSDFVLGNKTGPRFYFWGHYAGDGLIHVEKPGGGDLMRDISIEWIRFCGAGENAKPPSPQGLPPALDGLFNRFLVSKKKFHTVLVPALPVEVLDIKGIRRLIEKVGFTI